MFPSYFGSRKNAPSQSSLPGQIVTENTVHTITGALQTTQIRTDDKFIYASCNILNPITATLPILAVYSEQKGITVLERSEEYDVSIIRFNIPCDRIPIFYWTPNMYVTMVMGSGAYSAQVPYIQTNFTVDDYGIYDYSSFAQSINTALTTAYAAAIAANPGFTGYCPFIEYDPVALRFSVTADINWQDNNIMNPVLWFSFPLWQKFPMIYSQQAGYNNVDYLDDLIIFHFNGNNASYITMLPFLNNPSVTVTPTIQFLTMEQQSPGLAALTDIQDIFFTTNNIPVVSQLQPAPFQGNTNDLVLKVITDFQPVVTNTSDASPQSSLVYQYQATGPWRWISMLGSRALQTLDWQIYFRGKDYNQKPLYIAPGTNCSALIAFRKKPQIVVSNLGDK